MVHFSLLIKRITALLCLYFFLSLPNLYAQSCPAQGTSIFPELTGQALITALVQEYGTTDNIGYNPARDILYGDIDNHGGEVTGIYTGYTITLDPNADPSTDAYSKDINAEHSWPQSKGASSEPARSDMHHLFPAYTRANSSRGNAPFIDIPDAETDNWWRLDQSTAVPDGNVIDEYSEFRESHPHPSYNRSWEPRESVKGDIARAAFYFYTMYKTQADAADPNFFEVQKEYLRAWNSKDSVSTIEYNRTCAIAAIQGNEVNPFVIDPTLAERAYFEGDISQTNVSFSASVLNFVESDGSVNIEVAITNPNADTATTVEVAYAGGTATPGSDFESFSTATLNFPAGSIQRQSFTLTFIDDAEEEVNETLFFTLQNVDGPAHAFIAPPDTLEISLRDNDGTAPSSVWVNEFHYDNDGGDQNEFVEIAVNAEFADLSNVTLTLYNGSNGSSYATYSGTDFMAGDTENGISFYYVDLPANGLQNGSPDGMSLDIDGELIQFISYEGVFTATEGPAQNVESTDIGAEESKSAPITNSLSLAGTGSKYDDFTWENTDPNTKGAVNTNQTIKLPVSTEREADLAEQFVLHQNFPNPFNPETTIRFELKNATNVSLSVYNVLGKKVATLTDGIKSAGLHTARFDASALSSGVYFYQLQTNEITLTQKMVLSK